MSKILKIGTLIVGATAIAVTLFTNWDLLYRGVPTAPSMVNTAAKSSPTLDPDDTATQNAVYGELEARLQAIRQRNAQGGH
jgi:hypothetical protein